jgi:hypothetical protein
MSVAELLQQSMAQHRVYQQLARARDITRAKEAMKQARDLREYALSQDPTRSDPAWAEEQTATPTGRDTHEELTAFYAEYLG